MPSKYVDITSIMQVIGNVFRNPQILDFTDKYTVIDEDYKNTIDGNFRIHQDNVITPDIEIKWNIDESNPHWTNRYPYNEQLKFTNRPLFQWRDYNNNGDTKYPVKYLINIV